MSPISRDDLHRIFKNLDKSNSGLITTHDLHNLLDTIGLGDRDTTVEELEKLVGMTSLDYIDFVFFYEAMIAAKKDNWDTSDDDDDDALRKAFNVFDLNGDGFISSDELQTVLSRLGMWDKNKSGHDCKDMILVYDKNADGVLDFQEFKDMMSVPHNLSGCD